MYIFKSIFIAHFVALIGATALIQTNNSTLSKLSSISEPCRRDLILYFNTLSDYEVNGELPNWADLMMDAYGSVQAGITSGNVYWDGDFDGCLKISVKRSNSTDDQFFGQYCMAFVRSIAFPTQSYQVATCSPSTCTVEDLNLFYGLESKGPLNVTVVSEFCQTKLPLKMDDTDLGISAMMLSLVCLVILSSLYELWLISRPEQSSTNKLSFLTSFSAISNTSKLLTLKQNSEGISCIHGLRAISMSWVVAGHCLMLFNNGLLAKNLLDLLVLFEKNKMQILESAEFAVDTFLFISGFLTSYILMSRLETNPSFNYIWYLIHRLWRILPCYLFMLALMSGPFPYASKSPMSPGLLVDRDACREQWWYHALFIHIYFHDLPQCLPQTWYMCLDMTFYAFYPIILYPLHKKKIIGYIIFGLLMATSIILPLVFIYQEELEPIAVLMPEVEKRKRYNELIYETPWGRIAAGFIGLAFGYVAFLKPQGFVMKKIVVYALWLLAAVIAVSITYCVFPYYSMEKKMTLAFKVGFGAFSRAAWCLIVGWIIIACMSGYGSLINKILSWKGFVIVSRLSFCMYLTHFSVLIMFFGSIKQNVYLDLSFLNYLIMIAIIGSAIAAYFLNLLIESPFNRLEKYIFWVK